MNKLQKTLVAGAAIIAMGTTMVTPAMAADAGTASITITNTTSEHLYEAIPLGSYANAELNTDGTVKGLDVESNSTVVNAAETVLDSMGEGYKSTQYADNPIGYVAWKLRADGDNWQGKLRTFVTELVKQSDVSSLIDAATNAQVTATSDTTVINGLSDGYYLVIDASKDYPTNQDGGRTDSIPMLVGTTVNGANFADGSLGKIEEKSTEAVVSSKLVDSTGADTTDNDHQIGDKVYYDTTITAPVLTGYDTSKYIFRPTITLPTSLSFNDADLTVTVNGTKLDTTDRITHTKTSTAINLSSYVADGTITTGTVVDVKYSAILLNTAKSSTVTQPAPITASAILVYTKDALTGNAYASASSKVSVYTYQSSFTNVDFVDNSVLVAGSTFTISRDGSALKVTKTADGVYVIDPAGTDTLTTDANGKFVVNGLDSAKYTFAQVKAGAGHVTVPNGTTADFTITATRDDNGAISGLTSTGAAAAWFFKANTDLTGTFYNAPKITSIPATGGIGLFVFLLAIIGAGFAWRKSRTTAE